MAYAPYLTCHQISLSFGPTQLFKGLSWAVHPGERWGIVGPNGAGKSTLFRVLIGEQAPDGGKVAVRNGIRVAVVQQKFEVDQSLSVQTILRQSLPPEYDLDAQREIVEHELTLHAAIAETTPDVAGEAPWLDKLSKLQDRLDDLSGAGTANILESALRAGKLEELAERSFSTLSGGQQKRVQIVAALLQNPQLVLLDEPTNHLDVQTVDWLEEFLLEIVEQGVGLLGFRPKDSTPEPFAFVIISHDRALLDTLVNRVLEIDQGVSRVYEGNYEQYATQKLENDMFEKNARAKLTNLFKRELAWLRRGPAARTTKQTARIDRANALGQDLRGKKQKAAVQTKSTMEFDAQIVSEQRNTDDQMISVQQTLGEQQLVVFKSVSVAHPDTNRKNNWICKNLDLIIKPRMRLALLGPNGCGKSTLLNMLAHVTSPTEGEVTFHELTKISYFDQQRNELDKNATVRTTVAPEGEYVFFANKYMHVMSYLERFLFFRVDCDRSVRELSGGEQARLLLAKLMLEHGNLLILDEPTNDLDITTLQILEQNLIDFQGGLIFTSHDRYFLQRVATQILTYAGEKQVRGGDVVGQWMVLPDLNQAMDLISQNVLDALEPSNRSAQNTQRTASATASTSGSATSVPSVEASKKKKMTFAEQKEFSQIEGKIAKLESEIATLTANLEKAFVGERSFSETSKISKEIQSRQADVSAHTKRWEVLFEKQ